MIEQYEVDMFALQHGQCLRGGVRARDDAEAGHFGHVRRVDLGHTEVVVHHEDVDHWNSPTSVSCWTASVSGRTTVKTAPPPALAPTRATPP